MKNPDAGSAGLIEKGWLGVELRGGVNGPLGYSNKIPIKPQFLTIHWPTFPYSLQFMCGNLLLKPSKYPMIYSISKMSLQSRKKNIIFSALLSLVLIVVVTAGHLQDPETYNDMFFWSVIIVVVVGNAVNYYRHRRYLCMVEDHRIEIVGHEVFFYTSADKSILKIKDISGLTFYRRKGQVKHIQLKLRNNRGIRMEGYSDLEQLGVAIADRIPQEQVFGREP